VGVFPEAGDASAGRDGGIGKDDGDGRKREEDGEEGVGWGEGEWQEFAGVAGYDDGVLEGVDGYQYP